MFNRRAQQSSFGMSFNMIFSIFLIIIFIAFAFIIIKVFLDFSSTSQIGRFYSDLEREVTSASRESTVTKTFNINLPKKIESVCFANLSAPITGSREIYDEIQHYTYYDSNVFLIPPGAAGDLDMKFIRYLDIERITENQNPYCVSNPGELVIEKGIRSRFVIIS